jgi:ADP-ribose pyrophosphatase YjhB (NUDIX family)
VSLRRRAGAALTPAFRTWFRLTRPMTLGVRAMIEDEKGRILLIRHTYVEGWHFPGGGVERGQTALEALACEVRDEAGLALEGAPDLVGLFRNPRFEGDHIAFYRIARWRTCGAPDPREIAEWGWFETGRLPEGANGSVRARLAEAAGAAPASTDW